MAEEHRRAQSAAALSPPEAAADARARACVAASWPILSPCESATPEQVLELARLAQILAALPDEQRAAWVLRYVEGHKLKQIATLCECCVATAKRRIAAADVHIRKYVELEEDEDAV